MKSAFLAALAAALALPVAAEEATPRVQPRTTAVATATPSNSAEKAVTPRENARIAKAQNRDLRCATKDRPSRKKKAAAT